MAMGRRKIVAATAIALVAVLLISGILWVEFAGNRSQLYTYPVSVGDKTYTITVQTDWGSAPNVALSNSSLNNLKYVSIDFVGAERKTVTFNATIPTDLLGGNITLIWKYYEQSPDRYTLSNNGTQNSVYMTFNHVAVDEHFEIRGTEGAL